MTLWERYLRYFSEVCAGTRPLPPGLTSQAEDEMAKVVELQTQVLAMGIPAFAAACAAQDGETIPQAELDGFDLQAVLQSLEEKPAEPCFVLRTRQGCFKRLSVRTDFERRTLPEHPSFMHEHNLICP